MDGNSKPILFNVSGPYAVGKDTILNELVSTFGPRLHRVGTITTRPVSKTADPTYEHVSRREFKRKVSNGRWIANYQLSGLTAYGTSIDEIEDAVRAGSICVHSVFAGEDGAGRLREVFGSRVVSVGLLAAKGTAEEQLETLMSRLLGRQRDEAAAIEARLQHQLGPLRYVIDNPSVMTEDGAMRVFDHVLINENLKDTVKLVVGLLEREFVEVGKSK